MIPLRQFSEEVSVNKTLIKILASYLVGLVFLILGLDLALYLADSPVTFWGLVLCGACVSASIRFGMPFLRWYFKKPPSYFDKLE